MEVRKIFNFGNGKFKEKNTRDKGCVHHELQYSVDTNQ